MMGGMDPEEAMMMGMDPEEAMMMGEMGMGGAAPAKKRGRRRLSIDNAPVNRSLEEIVAYFMMRREDAGKQRCEHVEKHLQIPAGFIDIKLKKMFKECRSPFSSLTPSLLPFGPALTPTTDFRFRQVQIQGPSVDVPYLL